MSSILTKIVAFDATSLPEGNPVIVEKKISLSEFREVVANQCCGCPKVVLGRELDVIERRIRSYNSGNRISQLNAIERELSNLSSFKKMTNYKAISWLQEKIQEQKQIIREQEEEIRRSGVRNKEVKEAIERFDLSILNEEKESVLTDGEAASISYYIGGDKSKQEFDPNSDLRKGEISAQYFEDILLMVSGLSKLETYGENGILFRRSDYLPSGIKDPRELVVGDIYEEKTLLSTSQNKQFIKENFSGKYMIQIENNISGKSIESIASNRIVSALTGQDEGYGAEEEVLFASNRKFRYLGMDYENENRVYRYEEVRI